MKNHNFKKILIQGYLLWFLTLKFKFFKVYRAAYHFKAHLMNFTAVCIPSSFKISAYSLAVNTLKAF